ncbi:hypothetical protein ShirakiTB12_53780 [Priestia megaterium]|uniref:Uncharacterized protein n=1 Tax=Priestia megaterium TaxID=1404 RepID=A0AAX6BTC8_PRIMG|nr:hypothetical protein ShirakiTB12_53780 [Priestia megaterium]
MSLYRRHSVLVVIVKIKNPIKAVASKIVKKPPCTIYFVHGGFLLLENFKYLDYSSYILDIL